MFSVGDKIEYLQAYKTSNVYLGVVVQVYNRYVRVRWDATGVDTWERASDLQADVLIAPIWALNRKAK